LVEFPLFNLTLGFFFGRETKIVLVLDDSFEVRGERGTKRDQKKFLKTHEFTTGTQTCLLFINKARAKGNTGI
jgi:hypothetical protein